MKIVISPVGTSSLTNSADNEIRNLLNTYANAKRREDIPKEDLKLLDAHVQKRRGFIASLDKKQAKQISAELHSLLILLEESPPEARDVYFLIPTSTYIGVITMLIVQDFLEALGLNVRILRVNGLQTKSSLDLHLAFSELVVEIDTIFKTYTPMFAKIIFNLTGGFKAIQGFLQTLSVVYADETIYIFEKDSELMRIPRLPIKIVPGDYIKENPTSWRRLALGLAVEPDLHKQIPDTFIFRIEDECTLSEYGRLVWNNVQCEIYSKNLLDSPSGKIAYGEKFHRSLSGLNRDQLCAINTQIDILCRYLETGNSAMLKSLSFKTITKNAKPGSTHEFYAWSNDGAKRVYCHYTPDNILILDELGDHL